MDDREADALLFPVSLFGEILRLVGGPNDGAEIRVKQYRDRWHIPFPPDISLAALSTDPVLATTTVGVYEARVDPSTGRRARADDGAVLLDWRGWR